MNIPSTVELYDTTLRDGSQTPNVCFSLQDKKDILELLDGHVDYMEAGFPYANPADRELFGWAKNKQWKSDIIGFGMTGKGLDILIKCCDTACIVAKAWDLHVKDVLHMNLEDNLNMIEQSIQYLKDNGVQVLLDLEHFFDAYMHSKDYATEVIKYAQNADKIILCDTNGSMMTNNIVNIINNIAKIIDKQKLGIHGHNDSGLALANTLAAVDLGITHVQGTINGLGERCGNLDLCEIIPLLNLKKGIDLMFDIRKLNQISKMVEKISGFDIPVNKPFVGKNAFRHKGGLHVDAVLKNTSAYEHISPEKIGQERSFVLSEQSGRANIVMIAKEYGYDVDKSHPQVKEIIEKVNKGVYLSKGDILLHLNKKETFSIDNYVITIDKNKKATAKVRVKNIEKEEKGVGPVHALDRAMRKALSSFFDISKVKLINYKVTTLKETGTHARVEVFAEFACNHKKWSFIARDKDVIKASQRVLEKGYKYYLLNKSDQDK